MLSWIHHSVTHASCPHDTLALFSLIIHLHKWESNFSKQNQGRNVAFCMCVYFHRISSMVMHCTTQQPHNLTNSQVHIHLTLPVTGDLPHRQHRTAGVFKSVPSTVQLGESSESHLDIKDANLVSPSLHYWHLLKSLKLFPPQTLPLFILFFPLLLMIRKYTAVSTSGLSCLQIGWPLCVMKKANKYAKGQHKFTWKYTWHTCVPWDVGDNLLCSSRVLHLCVCVAASSFLVGQKCVRLFLIWMDGCILLTKSLTWSFALVQDVVH